MSFLTSPSQADEIKKLWQIKAVYSNTILELRALDPKDKASGFTKIFRGSQYSNIELLKRDFEDEAIRLNQLGLNIYVVMNSIKESFKGYSAKDKDIATRDLLLIDIDRATSTKEPASQKEVDAAISLGSDIENYLETEGWEKPIKVLSGNGCHLYYPLSNLPNDDKHKKLVSGSLQELANRFNNEIVKVDTSVFNASRITKVPGTISYKGEQSAERPYRMARVLR